MSEAIFAAGLTKAYAGKTVVDHLDLSVKRGRHPHGKRPAAGLRHARSCRALHTPCRPLLPLGIKRGRRGTHTPKKKSHPFGWLFFLGCQNTMDQQPKNKIVTQRSGHDFERRKTFAVEVDALARSPDIQRSFLSGGAAQI